MNHHVKLAGRYLVGLGLIVCTLLFVAGCAHQPAPEVPRALLRDELFPAPGTPIDKDSVFALSPAMREYADTRLRHGRLKRDLRMALLEALYTRDRLQLEYEASHTRNAAEAFEARSGNCLSLVIMTAAFAKHLGIEVGFRKVATEEFFTRNGGLLMASGHVNLTLTRSLLDASTGMSTDETLLVDFLPGQQIRRLRSHTLSEQSVTAMYFNNRAAELLAEGRLQDSYAWAREAVLADPGFTTAANTLAVIYMRAQHFGAAEQALRHVLALEPDSTPALTNLQFVLRHTDRPQEADTVAARLHQLQPNPPFHFFDLGRQAMLQHDYAGASQLFARELKRQPYQGEVYFWAAQAYWQLGDRQRAAEHLRQAVENSVTSSSRDLYSAKLQHLRTLSSQ